MPLIVKEHGAHLKACAAMLRLRLYDILCGLPPHSYEGAYKHLFRELVAEFTLTGSPSALVYAVVDTPSLCLMVLCHLLLYVTLVTVSHAGRC